MKLLNKFLYLVLLASCISNAEDSRFSVVILDTGIDLSDNHLRQYLCKTGHKDVTGKGLQDVNGHGTNVAGLLLSSIDPTKVCIKVVKYYHNNLVDQEQQRLYEKNLLRGLKYKTFYIKAIEHIYRTDYRMLNYSGNGTGILPLEEIAFRNALNRGSYIVVASGNDSLDLSVKCVSFPACYSSLNRSNKFRVVTDHGLPVANKGGPAKYSENGRGQCYKDRCMNGTSQATANYTNKLLKSLGYGYNRR